MTLSDGAYFCKGMISRFYNHLCNPEVLSAQREFETSLRKKDAKGITHALDELKFGASIDREQALQDSVIDLINQVYSKDPAFAAIVLEKVFLNTKQTDFHNRLLEEAQDYACDSMLILDGQNSAHRIPVLETCLYLTASYVRDSKQRTKHLCKIANTAYEKLNEASEKRLTLLSDIVTELPQPSAEHLDCLQKVIECCAIPHENPLLLKQAGEKALFVSHLAAACREVLSKDTGNLSQKYYSAEQAAKTICLETGEFLFSLHPTFGLGYVFEAASSASPASAGLTDRMETLYLRLLERVPPTPDMRQPLLTLAMDVRSSSRLSAATWDFLDLKFGRNFPPRLK